MKIPQLAALIIVLILSNETQMNAQQTEHNPLPYRQIPEHPSSYAAGNVISRYIDGLGYRYYWATEGLTEKDLDFAPSEDARNVIQTMEHLRSLSETILNASEKKPNVRPANRSKMSYEELRSETLNNLKRASDLCLGKSSDEIAEFTIIYQRGEQKSEFPYWNMINGQLSDAMYHVGQIVSFRRSSGNPMNPRVNVFLGKTSE